MTPVQVVAHNLVQDHYPHSYRSAVVAHIHLAANDYIAHADGCTLLTCQMSP